MTIFNSSVWNLLREWRRRRASESTRSSRRSRDLDAAFKLSRNRRSSPSRGMSCVSPNNSECLCASAMLLLSAGYAPVFRGKTLGDPALSAARKTVEFGAGGTRTYRRWRLTALDAGRVEQSNPAAACRSRAGAVAAARPTCCALHYIRRDFFPHRHLTQWRAHLLARLRQQIDITADPILEKFCVNYATTRAGQDKSDAPASDARYAGIAVPFRLDAPHGTLGVHPHDDRLRNADWTLHCPSWPSNRFSPPTIYVGDAQLTLTKSP